ncbi:PhoPQ-activated pathogenicity-related family protein [Rhodohalobacter sp. 614A]|uniref:PhoPQ-activated pathogenicity-related family protein n=1 Tax=Rhodohalobacter sp. 614A TaxID=2908649 RepID=UPI001F42B3A2|nr:PhoPQ-activated protein PqaA family protein [Rhodohalobacter sp. 614A]
MRAIKALGIFIFTLLVLVSCSASEEEAKILNPFEAYLSEVDPTYRYELQNTIEGENYKAHVIRMVSQTWLTEDIVDENEWWHWLTIVVPDSIDHSTALLWIGGGNRNDSAPTSVNPLILNAALATNSVTVDLHNVPFQPITFSGDERMDERIEDEIISYAWRKFLEGGARDEDAEWLPRLPMTAAAMRAMDTVTDFMQNQQNTPVDKFVVSGASKRGWTTWTTGIFDNRVIAIAPVVIDLLNIVPSFQHHWRAYGEWSPAIEDYEDENIMEWQYSAEYDRMLELIDPFSYPDSLDLPKYLINAASDEFFLPDSWQFYWENLPSPKYLRYVPNAGHSLENSDASQSLIAYYNFILNDSTIPSFNWAADTSGFEIQLDPENLPDELLLWNAHNPEARDFRLYMIDRIWLARKLEIPGNGKLSVEINTPDSGFTAWFVEATYNADSNIPFKQTTGVVVTPNDYPFGAFSPADSLGTVMAGE